MRKKPIELVEQGYKKYFNPNWAGDFFGCVADHLIANDAVPVVRCKGCIYYHKEIGCGFGQCSKCNLLPYPDDFCSYGERKDNDGLY